MIERDGVRVELVDGFWAPRRRQLAERTLPVLLERFEAHGVVDNFRRRAGRVDAPHQGLWFSDSDLYKWMEAAALIGRIDLLAPVVEVVVAAQSPDGYLHTYFGEPGTTHTGRFADLVTSHEWYCAGHLVEAGIAHEEATGETVLLAAATRFADLLVDRFGPAEGQDHRVDGHPEVELAMARLARRTGEERYLAFARFAIEHQLAEAGATLETVDLAGHAVRALYLASGIAEVAMATGDARYREAAERLFETMVTERSYPTGAVGGRWLGEAVGRPFELPEATAYAESCAAVAALAFSGRIWRLTGDARALDQVDVVLHNAVACGVGPEGDRWFYSQPHSVAPEAHESNPWREQFDFGQAMLLDWFPPERREWFDVTCCPPNLARAVASVDRFVAGRTAGGDLLVHLPLAARLVGPGLEVAVESSYPSSGDVTVAVTAAPAGGGVRVRLPDWSAARPSTAPAHRPVRSGDRMPLRCDPTWWETDSRVEGAAGTVFVRSGPVVCCLVGHDLPGVDLRLVGADPAAAPGEWFVRRPAATGGLHHPVSAAGERVEPIRPAPPLVAYHAWADRGPTTMQLRFPRVAAGDRRARG